MERTNRGCQCFTDSEQQQQYLHCVCASQQRTSDSHRELSHYMPNRLLQGSAMHFIDEPAQLNKLTSNGVELQ